MTLSTPDFVVIALYFALVLAVGLASLRRRGRGLLDYFASGRAMPWWLAGTSMVATTFAADTPLAVVGLVAANGVAGNWFWWAFALGGMITVFVFAPLWRRSRVLSDVALVELRYGGRPAAFLRAFRAVYVALLVNSIIIGWVTGAMLKVLRLTVLAGAPAGDARDFAVVLGLLAVVGIYSVLSGMWGIAWTDFLQFALAMGGCVALAWLAVADVGGLRALESRVGEVFGNGGQALRFLPDFTSHDAWMPLHAFLLLLLLQWWATWYPGAEPGGGGYVVQRMASCKDERHALLATLWYQIAHYCLRPWPWILVALAALVRHPELRVWATDDNPATDAGVGFPMLMSELLPAGLRGWLLVAFFAAYMSTISTQMNWGASYLAGDLWLRFVAPQADERTQARVARVCSAAVLLLGAVASWWMRDVSVDQAWKLLAALGAGTGAVFMLRWFWWRVNAWSEISAMLASLGWFLLSARWNLGDEARMAFVALATIATWVGVTLLTPPERPEVLDAFYRAIHPAGPGWKPSAARCPDVRADRGLGRALASALAAAAVVYCVLPGVGFALFGHWASAAACAVGAISAALLLRVLMRRAATQPRDAAV